MLSNGQAIRSFSCSYLKAFAQQADGYSFLGLDWQVLTTSSYFRIHSCEVDHSSDLCCEFMNLALLTPLIKRHSQILRCQVSLTLNRKSHDMKVDAHAQSLVANFKIMEKARHQHPHIQLKKTISMRIQAQSPLYHPI